MIGLSSRRLSCKEHPGTGAAFVRGLSRKLYRCDQVDLWGVRDHFTGSWHYADGLGRVFYK